MRTDTPVTVYRKDYQPYPYDIPQVSLAFDLAPDSTEVRCVMQVRRKAEASADAALVLDGEELELVSVAVDGQALPPTATTCPNTAWRCTACPPRPPSRSSAAANPRPTPR